MLSFLIMVLPSRARAIVCIIALSLKALLNRVTSAFFIPANILLMTAFTESSVVCALLFSVKKKAVKSIKKYLMLTNFEVLWSMNCRPKIKSFIMKTMKIVPAVLLLALVAVITSCGTTRDYSRRPYPGSQTSVSLIIGPSPGLSIVRHSNGMYYYRDPRGHIYWRGQGNRYYLDRRYMNRSYHQHHQYNDWRRYHNRRR